GRVGEELARASGPRAGAGASEAKDNRRASATSVERTRRGRPNARARTHAPERTRGDQSPGPRASVPAVASAYFLFASRGVKPIIWTTAHRATSMASP